MQSLWTRFLLPDMVVYVSQVLFHCLAGCIDLLIYSCFRNLKLLRIVGDSSPGFLSISDVFCVAYPRLRSDSDYCSSDSDSGSMVTTSSVRSRSRLYSPLFQRLPPGDFHSRRLWTTPGDSGRLQTIPNDSGLCWADLPSGFGSEIISELDRS